MWGSITHLHCTVLSFNMFQAMASYLILTHLDRESSHAIKPVNGDFDYYFDKLNVLQLTRYLTIIPRARMGSESIAHEAEGRMGY